MSLNVQRSSQGETHEQFFNDRRRGTQLTRRTAVLPVKGLIGLMALLFGVALAENRADVPAPDPTVASGRTTPSTEEEPTPYKKLSLEELMKIEVSTVSRTESTVGQSPAAVAVITREDIRRSGATTIAELLRRVPGMDVARIDGNKWAVSSRGFNDRFVGKQLVQIDGRSLYNPINAGVYWDGVDYLLEDIERIEVIRGPGASVWGANAVNGIVNIITRSAKDTQGALLSGGGGTEERGFGGFRYGGKLSEDTYYRIYGKGFDRDQQFSLEGDPNDGWWSARGGFRLDWQTKGPDALTLEGDYYRSGAGRRDSRPTTNAPPFSFTNLEDEVTSGSD